ncbi:MAG: LysM peptidoglycan-binding domain-containing protein [Bdellovibrionota bacterium]
MIFARLLLLGLILQFSGCAIRGHSANDAGDSAVSQADLEDKDVDAEDVDVTPEDLGDVSVSPEASAKEKEADQMSRTTFPLVYNEFVQVWINYFTGRGRATFEKWLVRSTRYIPLMKQVLKEEGVPEDLIFLSMIESGFNPKAYSHAKAVGPWQFMEGTGVRYGLKVNFWIDERKDIVKSTHAAAQYLKELQVIFGSWYLAAAGYNAGEGRVLRAIRKEKSRNFWELAHGKENFRAETRNYVPKIIAAAILAKNPQKYGFSKSLPYEMPLAWDSVRVPGGVDLRAIEQVTGADLLTLQILNAELRTGVTPPDAKDGYEVRVPPEKKELLLSKMKELSRIQVASFINHKVNRGENLGYIARRYKTSVKMLLQLNRIRNPRALRVGQVLKVPLPRAGTRGGYVVPSKSKKSSRYAKKTSSRSRKVASRKSKKKSPALISHRVRRGDTLSEIADRYGVSMRDILKYNRLPGRVVKVGQNIKIPNTN